jgi:predicted transcriptional regulator
MFKSTLVDSVVAVLCDSGFRVVDCRGSRSSFDILARNPERLLLIKALANIEGLSHENACELKAVASLLGGIPLVVSQRMKSSELTDGTVYDRHGVYVTNPKTLSDIINDRSPKAYSTRGNYCVHVNTTLLTEVRRRHGYTQESLAKELNVSKQSVYRYESHGRMTLDVFGRLVGILGEGFAQTDFTLKHSHSDERVPDHDVTPMKRLVRKEFQNIGFDTTLTSAPFDMVACRERSVFSVVSNDWRRLEDKLTMLGEISELMGSYGLCISERKVKAGVSVISPRDLAQIKSPKELFKLLSDQ